MNINLKKIRQQYKISQGYLANKLGVSRPTYIQIEKGEKGLTVEQAKVLAELFNLSFENVFNEPLASVMPTGNPVKKEKVLSKLNTEKFRETLLYMLDRIGAKPNIGETAIYKLLYFIDFDFYEKYGKFLIGATYQKNHYGPTPVQFKKVIEDMIEEGDVELIKSKYFQYDQKKYLPRREPHLELFTVPEIKHIDEVLDRLSNKSAKELSDYSHEDVPWMATKDQDIIDYTLVFYRTTPYAKNDYDEMMRDASAHDILKELGDISDEESNYYAKL